MKKFHIRNQTSLIRDRNKPRFINEPTMPLVIVFEDGHIVQAISIRVLLVQLLGMTTSMQKILMKVTYASVGNLNDIVLKL